MLLADLSLHLRFSGGSGIADDSNKVQKNCSGLFNKFEESMEVVKNDHNNDLIKNIDTKM